MEHTPVMVNEVIRWLGDFRNGVIVDGTLGHGGHTRALLDTTGPEVRIIGFDRDLDRLTQTKEELQSYRDRFTAFHDNYSSIEKYLNILSGKKLIGFLIDLGVSSSQLDTPGRGFSFLDDVSMDMRMNPLETRPTAKEIINHYTEKDLADIFYRYGEEHQSRRISRHIVRRRRIKPFQTGKELGDYIFKISGHPHGHSIHPATKVFQALRIYINQELDHLSSALDSYLDLLAIGGRIVTIAFHSLEDRIIKRFMQLHSGKCTCPPELPACVCEPDRRLKILTKHPLSPNSDEIDRNPRSRSAKLRCAERQANHDI